MVLEVSSALEETQSINKSDKFNDSSNKYNKIKKYIYFLI